MFVTQSTIRVLSESVAEVGDPGRVEVHIFLTQSGGGTHAHTQGWIQCATTQVSVVVEILGTKCEKKYL